MGAAEKGSLPVDDPMLFGHDPLEGLVSATYVPGPEADAVRLLVRRGAETVELRESFRPFLWLREAALLDGAPVPAGCSALAGGGTLAARADFATWKDLDRAVAWLKQRTGANPSAPDAPYFLRRDPIEQYLLASGRTFFKGLAFGDLRRLQFDIETETEPGFDFSNAAREGDRIVAIGLADSTGWCEVIDARDGGEAGLLKRFVALVRERDPDVIEGHNLFGFDLPFLAERARRHRVRLRLGRDGSAPRVRASRFSAGERTLAYPRAEIDGRAVVDTFFLVQIYDVSHRSLPGFGLKEVARYFGIDRPDRTLVGGQEIGRVFREDPDRLRDYVRDDVLETQALSALLSPVYFAQAQLLPFTYQNVCVRGAATKIDALMLRAYLRERRAIPLPDPARSFEGGYTDVFFTGVVHNVHHCDVRSLYPSIMLSRSLGPKSDDLGAFLRLLDHLRTVRLDAKDRLRKARADEERHRMDALQSTYKVLINSFYGYLGFGMARFSDFAAAEAVTAAGRKILRDLIERIRALGGRPIEIDTDGIYFVPPAELDERGQVAFEASVADSLPQGIEIEFDGRFPAMFSYKMKNYALRQEDGQVVLTGAALKSRGLEPFQRAFVEEAVRLLLTADGAGYADLVRSYRVAIAERRWPIQRLAKTERLQDAPERYQQKVAQGRPRNAAYELALASGRPYRAGDSVSYYVTGERKSVAVHANAKRVADFDPEQRDENIAFYLAKLDALAKKFEKFTAGTDDAAQGELELT